MNLTLFIKVQPILNYCAMVVKTISDVIIDDCAELNALHIKWAFSWAGLEHEHELGLLPQGPIYPYLLCNGRRDNLQRIR
jgi:hypothetical protein